MNKRNILISQCCEFVVLLSFIQDVHFHHLNCKNLVLQYRLSPCADNSDDNKNILVDDNSVDLGLYNWGPYCI